MCVESITVAVCWCNFSARIRMEACGWLKKRSSGKIISWRRRYVVVDQSATLKYYDRECSTSEERNKFRGTRQLTSFFANVGALQKNLPKSSDVDRAFMFVTSDPRKPMMLVVAESIEEKFRWIEFLTELFLKEKLFDLSFLKESMFYSPSHQFTLPSLQKPSPFSVREINFPLQVYALISLFLGDVREVVALNYVCRGWNQSWKLSQPKLLHLLVRFGQVETNYRWSFWCHQLCISQWLDKDEFSQLIEQSTEFNQYEITKDVNRAFGTSTGKRMIERRSLAPCGTSTDHFQEGLDDGDADSPRRFGRGRMDSIPEDDVSSLNSEDRQVITQFLSSDDEQEDSFSSPKKCSNTASSTDGWGRVRSTQRWPTTPESKSSSSNPNNFRQPMLAPLESTATGAEEKLAEITAPTNAIDDRMETISEDDIQRKKASLTAILRALSTRFESVGYCQGMDRIVVHVMRAARCAVSLRSVPFGDLPRRDEITEERTRQCYSFLEAIFLRLSLSEIYSRERVFGLRLKIYQMTRLLEVYCPELQKTLQNDGLSLEIFTIGWIQTLFLYVEAMPAETIDRIWDIFIVESSWVIIFQVAIAIIRLATSSLRGKPLEAILEYFNVFPESEILEGDLLLAEACRIHITEEKLQHLQEIYFASGSTSHLPATSVTSSVP